MPSTQQNPSALNYASDAQKAGFYPNQQQQQQQQHQQHQQTKSSSSNPWEREEREKEMEMRRDQMRQWRDTQIVELSLLPSRTPQQEEQLKTLVLERDFERRAMEEENEEENDAQYQKNGGGVQEVLRLQQNTTNAPPSQITAPTTRLKQVDIKTIPTNISPSNENGPSDNYQSGPPVQPKSILKSTHAYNSNPSSPSKHGKSTSFAPKTQNLSEITMNNTNANQMLTQMNKDMGELTIEYQPEDTNGPMPPPPPERGSSFAVMHQQKVRGSGTFQKLSFNEQPVMNNNNTTNNNKYVPLNNNSEHSPMMMSPTGTFTAHQIQQQMNLINNNNNSPFTRDNKRVSFHDHENNNLEGITEQELSMIREDPNVSKIDFKFKIDSRNFT